MYRKNFFQDAYEECQLMMTSSQIKSLYSPNFHTLVIKQIIGKMKNFKQKMIELEVFLIIWISLKIIKVLWLQTFKTIILNKNLFCNKTLLKSFYQRVYLKILGSFNIYNKQTLILTVFLQSHCLFCFRDSLIIISAIKWMKLRQFGKVKNLKIFKT